MPQNTSDNFTLINIPDDWEPGDEDSEQQRALFLCHALDGHVRQNLFQLIAKCKAGAYGKEVQQAVQRNLNEWAVAKAIKEACCTCIHYAWLEQGGENASEWLLDYVLVSYQEADAVCAQPDSDEIIGHCEDLPIGEVLPDLTRRLCEDFGISTQSEAGILLKNLLDSSANLAGELLALSLTQPMESLLRHLQMYQR